MRERPSASELLAWSLVGLGLGLVAGIALGGWLGPIRRPARMEAHGEDAVPEVAPLKPAQAERAVRQALGQDPELSRLDLRALPVGDGVVEVHGWVPSRALRARAARLAARVPGIFSLVNSLLVHGEDDAAEPAVDATDQPA
jgi:BON domain